jgi:hypothetical protein
MATSSILGGDRAPSQPKGTGVDMLGPSDSSDSGSDVRTDLHRSALPDEGSEGSLPISHDSSSDAEGTGELASSEPSVPRDNADILPERIGVVPPGLERDPLDDAASLPVDELAATEDTDGDDEDDHDDDES